MSRDQQLQKILKELNLPNTIPQSKQAIPIIAPSSLHLFAPNFIIPIKEGLSTRVHNDFQEYPNKKIMNYYLHNKQR